MHLIDVIDCPNEQQLFIDTHIVPHYPSCQGATKGTPLVAPGGILGNRQCPSK